MLKDKAWVIQGGLVYEVAEPVRFGSKGVYVLIGYKLKECSDGWFQAFDALGNQCCFRIAAEIVKNIKKNKATT